MTKRVWRDKDTGKPIWRAWFQIVVLDLGTDYQYDFRQVETALSHTQGN